MTTLTTPIHVGEVNGKPLRFFRPPEQQSGLCWVAWDDLPVCVGLPSEMRRHFLQKLKEENGPDTRMVATADGIVTIGPNFMAHGFLASMVENGFATFSAEVDYGCGLKAAWDVMHADMPKPARVQMLAEALVHEARR